MFYDNKAKLSRHWHKTKIIYYIFLNTAITQGKKHLTRTFFDISWRNSYFYSYKLYKIFVRRTHFLFVNNIPEFH